MRVTLALDPVDVDLLDRLATLEGSNRSAELRSMLLDLRPMLQQVVEALEAALRTRDEFSQAAGAVAAAELLELVPEVQRLQNVMLGSLARMEGAAAVRAQQHPSDPRPSNHGGHNRDEGTSESTNS